MSDKINDGGPAFPWPVPTFDTSGREIGHSSEQPGMSLRDWFAGQALGAVVGQCTHADMAKVTPELLRTLTADGAYKLADAMLAARERKP